MTPEELEALAAAEAEKQAADAAAAAAAEAAKKKEEDDKSKLSDNEHRLLKDAMKHKAAAKEAEDALKTAKERLQAFDGLNPEELRKLLEEKKEAELKDAEKRGEYDRILKQVRDDADSRIKAKDKEQLELQEKLAAFQRQVDELTVGSSFRGSKFIAEQTVLSGDKARRLFGDHFEIEDGELVAYDKPRGASDRTPLVDTRLGTRLNFEQAIEKIIKADQDFESLAKSKMKPGSGSAGSQVDKSANDQGKKVQLSGRQLIAANLGKKK